MALRYQFVLKVFLDTSGFLSTSGGDFRLIFFFLDQAKQTDQPGLMLASENAACLSTRLREKADQLRALCENAKNWEGDIKRAGENLRRRLETANQKPVKALEISPLNGKFATFWRSFR